MTFGDFTRQMISFVYVSETLVISQSKSVLSGAPSWCLQRLAVDGKYQNLRRYEGDVLVEKKKVSEPQVWRVADPGEQGRDLVSREKVTEIKVDSLQLDEGPGHNPGSRVEKLTGFQQTTRSLNLES